MKLRLAGEALKWLFKNQNAAEIAFRVVPDVGFGILEGTLTPGDIGDKVIAGTGSALGGLGGGLLLGKLGGNNEALTTMLDMAGSIGGDFGGRFVADQALKGKYITNGIAFSGSFFHNDSGIYDVRYNSSNILNKNFLAFEYDVSSKIISFILPSGLFLLLGATCPLSCFHSLS